MHMPTEYKIKFDSRLNNLFFSQIHDTSDNTIPDTTTTLHKYEHSTHYIILLLQLQR